MFELQTYQPADTWMRRFWSDPFSFFSGSGGMTVFGTDIADNGDSYLLLENGKPIATWAFIRGPEPTYAIIYNGKWLNRRAYHVIHRVASMPGCHGVMRDLLEWCFSMDGNIRIDTHRDNAVMRHCLAKYGFTYCGIIHLQNGDERLAYQKTSK